MEMTPAVAAKVLTARREIEEMLTEWGAPGAEARAEQIVHHFLRKTPRGLGWTPPLSPADEPPPPLRPEQPAEPDGPGFQEFQRVRARLATRRAT